MKTPELPTPIFNPQRIRAITLDLDDTLWPIWPTIARAEGVLQRWLDANAPATAALGRDKDTLRAVRTQMQTLRPDLAHDISGLRRESIRLLLQRAGDDPALAEAAFEVFFAERQRVDLFEDALPALEFLASRFPLVALSNGNADVHRVGLGAHFRASISAFKFGVAKPDVRIFHAAADAAQVQPHEVLHVGDDATLDAQGALDAGMQAVWINTANHPWPHAALPHATVGNLTALRLLFS